MKAVHVTYLLVAGLALCGCFGAEPVADQAAASGSTADTWEAHLEAVASDLGIEDPPHVTPIREVSPAEGQALYDACMADEGWQQSADGSFSVPEAQEEALDLSDYTCLARYPIRPEYLEPLTTAQWGAMYDYWIATTIPCYERHGLSVDDVPSRDTFLGNPSWHPAQDISSRLVMDTVVRSGEAKDVNDFYREVCPGIDGDDLRGLG